jgi:Intracellular proteinase inhibitor
MNTRLIISLLCAGALAFACGPRSRADVPVALASMLPVPTNPFASHPDRPRSASNARAEVKLDTRFNVVIDANAVHFALVVKNVGGKHAEVNFADGQSYDFVVSDSAGRVVWQWSDGRMFTQSVRNKQLGAGDSMRMSEAWKRNDATPGRYTVKATLKSSNYPSQQHAEFVLP